MRHDCRVVAQAASHVQDPSTRSQVERVDPRRDRARMAVEQLPGRIRSRRRCCGTPGRDRHRLSRESGCRSRWRSRHPPAPSRAPGAGSVRAGPQPMRPPARETAAGRPPRAPRHRSAGADPDPSPRLSRRSAASCASPVETVVTFFFRNRRDAHRLAIVGVVHGGDDVRAGSPGVAGRFHTYWCVPAARR